MAKRELSDKPATVARRSRANRKKAAGDVRGLGQGDKDNPPSLAEIMSDQPPPLKAKKEEKPKGVLSIWDVTRHSGRANGAVYLVTHRATGKLTYMACPWKTLLKRLETDHDAICLQLGIEA